MRWKMSAWIGGQFQLYAVLKAQADMSRADAMAFGATDAMRQRLKDPLASNASWARSARTVTLSASARTLMASEPLIWPSSNPRRARQAHDRKRWTRDRDSSTALFRASKRPAVNPWPRGLHFRARCEFSLRSIRSGAQTSLRWPQSETSVAFFTVEPAPVQRPCTFHPGSRRRRYACTNVVTRRLARSRSAHSRSVSASCSRFGMP
jgi:hypothetical protein